MPHFSATSMSRLKTCHPLLQMVLEKAIIDGPDFTILWGHRGMADQNKMYADGHSKAKFGESPHNSMPSQAFDVAPWPIDWNDLDRFRVLAGYILGIANGLGIHLRWGGDWDGDWEEKDEKFRDFGHFELADWRN